MIQAEMQRRLRNKKTSHKVWDNYKIQGLDLAFVSWEGMSFISAQLDGVDLYHACLDGVDFGNATIQNTRMSGAIIENVSFTGVKFKQVDFRNARFHNVDFENATFEGVRFSVTGSQEISVKDIVEFDIPDTKENVLAIISQGEKAYIVTGNRMYGIDTPIDGSDMLQFTVNEARKWLKHRLQQINNKRSTR